MSSHIRILSGSLCLAVWLAAAVNAQPIDDPISESIVQGDLRIDLELVVDGLTAPLGTAVPDDGTRRMFVYDQAGLAWVVVNGSEKLATPLLDVRSRLVPLGNYDERGLLGLAIHPDFANHPFVYTCTSEPNDSEAADFVAEMPAGETINHQSVIAEWRVDANAVDDVPGAGNGYVSVFDPNGVFVRRFATQCQLNSPWAIAHAPADFGGFGGAILIGNFGDGRINAYHPATGVCMGPMLDAQANPIEIEGLWGLVFGNGDQGGDPRALYFTAGIANGGVIEDHGLFGKLVPVTPE